MSNNCGLPTQGGQSGDGAPPGRPVAPFYLSPTWHWPEFDPACCQECGRVIPMHETGWILNETILCLECFEILDERQAQRRNWMQEHEQQQRERIPVVPAADQRLELEQEETCAPRTLSLTILAPPPVAEPAFELTPPVASEYRPDLVESVIEDQVPAAAACGDSLPLIDAMIPRFKLTEPDAGAWRAHFADPLLTGQNEDPAVASTTATDALPLIDAMIPRFELTEPDAGAWRIRFADSLLTGHDEDPAVASPPASDALPLIDAMIPRFELTEPDAGAWRAHFADPLLTGQNDDPVVTSPKTTDALPLIDAMVPRFRLTEPDRDAWRMHFADPLIDRSGHAPAAASVPASASVAATPLFDTIATPSAKSVKPAKPTKPAPKTKAKARKRRSVAEPLSLAPPVPAPVLRTLSFQHPVDALLDDLHERTIDAQFRQRLHQARSHDPFFAEVDAMLAAASQLRDQWMSRPERQVKYKWFTG